MRLVLGITCILMIALAIACIVLFFIHPFEAIRILGIVIAFSFVISIISSVVRNIIRKYKEKWPSKNIDAFLRYVNKIRADEKLYVSQQIFDTILERLDADIFGFPENKYSFLCSGSYCHIAVDSQMKDFQFDTQPVEPYITSIDDFNNI